MGGRGAMSYYGFEDRTQTKRMRESSKKWKVEESYTETKWNGKTNKSYFYRVIGEDGNIIATYQFEKKKTPLQVKEHYIREHKQYNLPF